VRDIWHWVTPSPEVLDHARAVANQLIAFTRDFNASSETYHSTNLALTKNKRLFTDPLWRLFRKKKAQPIDWPVPAAWGTEDAHYDHGGKMFGVLRGETSVGVEWHYAMSGGNGLGGAWCEALRTKEDADGTSHKVMNYVGPDSTYLKTTHPFDVSAMHGTWGQFGRCAAPALLDRARRMGLQNLQIAEIYIHSNGGTGARGKFSDRQEIGSCEQCRRFLGRLLCERGPR
jgi:hypothetical protein